MLNSLALWKSCITIMKCKQTGRCILLTICILQMISTTERQLFDFLGRMWLPILCNFFNFIFVIFGFFGAYQYKPKYIIIYVTWMVIWLAWNVFIICFYLNVGSLSNKSDWLNFGTGSASWWEVPGIIVSIYLIKIFFGHDDNCKKKPASIYYVEYSSPTREESESPELDLEDSSNQQPMTPRKVKRQNRYRNSGRSQGRGTQLRNSKGRSTQSRISQRTRRPQYLNPVTQLIDKANESSTSTDSYRPPVRSPPFGGRQGHSNPMYVHSRPNSTYSLNGSSTDPVERPPSVHSSYSNYHGQRPSLNPNPSNRHTYRNSTYLPNPQRKNQVERGRSTFRPEPSPVGDSTFSGDTYSESERPPPYMFGVNSETVI